MSVLHTIARILGASASRGSPGPSRETPSDAVLASADVGSPGPSREAHVRRFRVERLALVCSTAAAVLLALTQALAVAPYASADEAAHVDYAYQVWHGGLPVFEEGLELRPPGGFVPPVQWVAQHPPLYYLLLAPVVGLLADAGLPVAASYAARGVSIVLFALLVVVSWWSVRQVVRPGSTLPVVTALLVACTAWAARLGGSAYNDMLTALLVTALLGLTLRSLRHGLGPRLLAGLVLIAAACALTRTSAMIVAVVCLAAALLGAVLRARLQLEPARRAVALAVAAPAAVALASGWFYVRNVRLTGSITGGHPDWSTENLGRETRSLGEAVTDLGTWGELLDLFQWRDVLSAGTAAVVLLLVPAVAAAATLRPGARGTTPAPPADPANRTLAALPVLLLVGATGAVLAVQIAYTAANGSAHPRYLLPVVLPLCLAVGAGLSRWPRVAIPAWVAVVLWGFVRWVAGGPAAPVVPGGYVAQPGASAVTCAVAVAVTAAAVVLVVVAVRRGRRREPAA